VHNFFPGVIMTVGLFLLWPRSRWSLCKSLGSEYCLWYFGCLSCDAISTNIYYCIIIPIQQ